MSPDPVEEALNEMLAALKEGAHPWTVPPEVGEKYKDKLRADFQGRRAPIGDKPKRMARHSGSLAALIAECANPEGPPRDLTEDEVLRGAAIVKESKACPFGIGRFCQQASFSPLQEALDGLFRTGRVTDNEPEARLA